MDLAHDQSGPHLEADVEDRAISVGHLDPIERFIGAVVGGLAKARLEEESEESAGEYQHHEAIERDLAEHERPVIREHLVESLLREGGGAQTVVDPLRYAFNHGHGSRSPARSAPDSPPGRL
jgi:hypothetical protein